MIHEVLKARLDRRDHFPECLFSDPAWDLLLNLYAARLNGRRSSNSDLAAASGVTAASAERWLLALEDQGLVQISKGRIGGGQSYAALSEKGMQSMVAYFRGLPAQTLPI